MDDGLHFLCVSKRRTIKKAYEESYDAFKRSMKKFFVAAIVALAGFTTASAQEKGDMAVGINVGVAPCVEGEGAPSNFGIGAKFQYNVSNPIRLEGAFNYWLKSKEVDILDVAVNAHYIFNLSSKVNLYPLVGVGYARVADTVWGVDFSELYNGNYDKAIVTESSSVSRVLVNVGVGVEYAVSEKVSIGAEVKYQYIKDFNRVPINVGVTYKF